MKKFLKYTVYLILIGLISVIAYVKFALPNVGEAEIVKIELSEKRIERGRYLANSVTVCMDCHSKRDWNQFSGPLVKGTLGQGGEEFSQKFGFPGVFTAKNITPFHLGSWTDGEILRAIASGVNKDGKALFPVMPHANYGKMDKEDLLSIIAYLRTLEPIKHNVKESEPDFPMSLIINTIPQKASYNKIPSDKNSLAYGQYIFNAASCNDCHTKQEKGAPIEGMELAGGFEFPLPTGGTVRSANITFDKETGIGNWSEEAFVARFKMYADSSFKQTKIGKNEFNTVMPWMMYSQMEEADLKAIYRYLKSQKKIKNTVEKFSI